MPNRDTYTSGCVYINFATALEMLMNNGRLHYYGDELIGLETGDPTRFQTWEEFYDAYKAQHINLLQKAFQQQHIVDRLRPQHFAAPLSSVLHNLCMKNMRICIPRRLKAASIIRTSNSSATRPWWTPSPRSRNSSLRKSG